jgi:hypothetical protein
MGHMPGTEISRSGVQVYKHCIEIDRLPPGDMSADLYSLQHCMTGTLHSSPVTAKLPGTYKKPNKQGDSS